MCGESPILTLKEVLDTTTGVLITGASDIVFFGICTDSRRLRTGNLFVALKGEKYDGHDFVQNILEFGVAGVVISDARKIKLEKVKSNVAIIKVNDSLDALGNLARYWRDKFSVPVIGLTGSSGKTTTKEMMAAIIGRQKNILKTEGNLNNLIGLPQTIFCLTKKHEAVILEMGTNTPGEIRKLTQIAAPDIGLITNIGPAHLAGFGSVEGVCREKGDLFVYMKQNGTIIINLDDENVKAIAEKAKRRRISFGLTGGADVTVREMEKIGVKGIRFKLIISGKTYAVEMKITGTHNIYNAMAAAATAEALGISHESILEGLAAFRPVTGRMEIIRLKNGAYLINDSYNANPASMRESLMTLKDLKNGHNSYAFLGDMLELGEAAEEMHRKIGMFAAVTGVNTLFLQGDFAQVTAAGALEGGLSSKSIHFLSDLSEDIINLKKLIKKGDWILVKGSRRMGMEKITSRICDDFGCETIK